MQVQTCRPNGSLGMGSGLFLSSSIKAGVCIDTIEMNGHTVIGWKDLKDFGMIFKEVVV